MFVVIFYRNLGEDKRQAPITYDLSLSFNHKSTKMLVQLKRWLGFHIIWFQTATAIHSDATIFGIDNGNIPLYINMQDVFKIIKNN